MDDADPKLKARVESIWYRIWRTCYRSFISQHVAVYTELFTVSCNTTIVASDVEHDLAILRVIGAPLTPMKFAPDGVAREGDGIAFTGFPIGVVLGLYPVTHKGIIFAITPITIPARSPRELTAAQIVTLRDPYKVLQLDATAYPRNSGSPVYLRDSGTVVGVINHVLVKGKKENVLRDPSTSTCAIPIVYLRKLLQSLR